MDVSLRTIGPALLALLAVAAAPDRASTRVSAPMRAPLAVPWQPPGSDAFRRALYLLSYGSPGDRRQLTVELADSSGSLHPVERGFVEGRIAYDQGRDALAAQRLVLPAGDGRFRSAHVSVDFYLGMARHRLGDPASVDCLRAYLQEAPAGADPGLAEAARRVIASAPPSPAPAPATGPARSVGSPNIVWGEPPDVSAPPPAPWALRQRGGGEATLASLPGSVLLLHFWASWCVPCAEELPGFITFTESSAYAPLRDRGLHPVLISADTFLGEAEAFLRMLRLEPAALYHDPNQRLLETLRDVIVLPLTIVMERESRRVLGHVDGPVDWASETTRVWLDGLLEGAAAPPAPPPQTSQIGEPR